MDFSSVNSCNTCVYNYWLTWLTQKEHIVLFVILFVAYMAYPRIGMLGLNFSLLKTGKVYCRLIYETATVTTSVSFLFLFFCVSVTGVHIYCLMVILHQSIENKVTGIFVCEINTCLTA